MYHTADEFDEPPSVRGSEQMQKVINGPECPECAAEVRIDADARVSEIIECADCRSELEIASVEPPVLTAAPEVEEDWGE
jgi:alpha-aminoadipate carrier protein LysW